MSRPQATIAIVSYNTCELLRRCLRSLADEMESGLARVVVVDNASSDGSAEMVADEFPEVQLLALADNIGFGRAVNLAAETGASEWLVIANADVQFTPGALESLIAAGADPAVGAIAPRLIMPDGSTQHSIHSFPSAGLAGFVNLGLYRFFPRAADRLLIEGTTDLGRVRDVDWALGALLVVRRHAFEAIRGFDPSQWIYAEDLDLQWRLRENGWRVRYEPRAGVRHEGSAATKAEWGDQRHTRHVSAGYAWMARRRGAGFAWSNAAVNTLGNAVRIGRHPGDARGFALMARLHSRGLRSRRTLIAAAPAPPPGVEPTRPPRVRVVPGAVGEVAGDGTNAGSGTAAARRLIGNGQGLRSLAARGVVINTAFQIGFATLTMTQRIVAAAFLTASEFGVWGIALIAIITLGGLRQIGIADKFIQQDEPDQERAFQKAFTLDLLYTLCFCFLVALFLPLYALIYDRPEVLLPSLVLSLVFIGGSLSSPTWIFYREMRFVKQRVLDGTAPVVSTAVMIPLAVAGAGYWSLVAGLVAGSFAAAAAALIACPYKIAFRFDRGALSEYFVFSWPLLVNAGSGLIVLQGTILVANHSVGLAGVGAIVLASSLIVFAQRVEQLVSRTMYPAVCAVSSRLDLLHETFVKSNRLAMMWGLPFGVGLFMFAPQLVDHLLGEKWEVATPLLQGLGLIAGFRQLGFSWALFYRARAETRPIMLAGFVGLAVYALALAPLIIAFGLDGYVAGMAIALVVDLGVRIYYLRRLFPDFNPFRHTLRAFLPSIPAVALVLAIRAVNDAESSSALALGEFALYVVVTMVVTIMVERPLLREITGYLRGGSGHGSAARSPTAYG
ncbi:MAG: oligosaccharide flippase family protein [Actinomycetota bacterium]|nr:oligosaccharide flippase family protein [Actinomycetota bacterium]